MADQLGSAKGENSHHLQNQRARDSGGLVGVYTDRSGCARDERAYSAKKNYPVMPLKIIVVGAGIAGLCAGIALRQAGHEVVVFEKSKFATEIGAALMITPNGAGVLAKLGFSFSNARAVKIEKWDVVRGEDQELMASVDARGFEKSFGGAMWSIHRIDLHNELRRLATSKIEPGLPIHINLASEVVSASDSGTITLRDGSQHSGDLVIAADGLHSVLKKVILGENAKPPMPTGLSAFRFLLDTEKLDEVNPNVSGLRKKGPVATLLADASESVRERHIMTYPCRGGDTYNFVGIHPTRPVVDNDPEAVKASMLEEFGHFAPEIVDVISQAKHAKVWPLYIYTPLTSWYKGRVLLVGDAAHPMLPFGGQGSNSAIEDAGTLGYIFNGVESAKSIPKHLHLFEQARRSRASRVQILSSVRAGREKEVEEKLRQFADPLGSKVPTTMIERTNHDYGFDVFKKCREVMTAQTVR